ncbi:two-component sensor histidine kinase [Bacillus sp. BHET2]|uniref:ATP-binding protein n=1 Tax=Bacillus sp. BHET2 TaxID=2583818 RepID=UPI00110D4EA0|nr:ATP-binding protein [Bacillus sp. BHET2]TMU84860.1 two-component sensor histidine kinase [Bacillus sp. BHET2]
MLVEKLLLHVLIILAPVLIQTSLLENHRLGKSPIFIGVLHGIAAFMCLIFAYESFGLYWDFRYIPLVLSMLYGGRKAGVIVFLFILTARIINGGDAIVFGFISAFLAGLMPFLISSRFWSFSPRKRVNFAVLLGFWPALVMLGILLSFAFISGVPVSGNKEMGIYVLIFGGIQVVGVGLAAQLNEWMIEKKLLREEILKSEKLNTLGELAASIAHEVRNPLTVVKGFLQLMKKQVNGDHDEYLKIVLSELGRAEEIINDYLNFAKPEFEKIEKINVKDVLSDVTLLLNAYALKEGVHLESNVKEDGFLLTDRNKLKQAFVNIIKNAIEATPSQGNVTVSLEVTHTQAIVRIKDTGKGMTKEQVARIGTLFYTTKDQGTGLGTSVSLRIIEAMGGHVHYSSIVNKGTSATISLPLNSEKVVKYDSKSANRFMNNQNA